jgi:DNA-binding GntR family transcriptional regulator
MPAEASFVPVIQSASLRSSVEESVAAAILSGQLPPGELVSVPVLAAKFDVSATPVREAMINLQQRGLVEPVRNKGFRVTEVSQRDLEEIVQLRRLVEPPMMRELVGRLDPAHEQRLRAMADSIVATAQAGDLRTYLAADVAFHHDLVAVAGNRRITDLVTDLRRQTRLVGLSDMLNTELIIESAREHEQLLDLLLADDADGAERLMHRHIGHVLGWWSGNPEGRAG